MAHDTSDLSAKQLLYIQYRATEDTNAAAYRKAGYSKQSWYRLDADLRDRLNEFAAEIMHDAKDRAIEIYQEEMAHAAARVISLAKTADNESVKLKANLDILERGGFRQKTQLDVTSADEPIGIQTIEVVLDYGPDGKKPDSDNQEE